MSHRSIVMNSKNDVAGSQSIARAIGLLRILTSGPREGMTLAHIAEAADLHVATTHRQLAALMREGLVEQDPARRYFPGVELWLMGQVAAQRFDITGIADPAMKQLAEETEDTVYLLVRSGRQAVCVARCEGSFPIRTLTLTPGDRRPLGVNAAALALLSFLDFEDREWVLSQIAPDLRQYRNYSVDSVRREIEVTRKRGYAVVAGTVIPGMSAVGVPILGREGHAIAALSVAAIEQRMTEPRRTQIARLAEQQARGLGKRLILSGKASHRKSAEPSAGNRQSASSRRKA
jgi:DNA-binding IclR family transcriptional regulator